MPKIKKDSFFFLKILFAISLASSLSYYEIKACQNEEKLVSISKQEKNTENFLTKKEQTDLKEIKKEIDILNNPPKPEPIPEPTPEPPVNNPPTTPSVTPPSIPGSAKEIFQRNRALIIGNSFVEGMTAYGVLYPSNAIWSRGIRIDNMDSQLEQAISINPNILILSYGTNDILSWGSNVSTFIQAYRTKLQQIKTSLPNTTIYICSILPVTTATTIEKPAFQYIDLYNQELAKLSAESGVTFLNSGYLLPKDASAYAFDGIHPNGSFYPKWAADIINKIGMR